MKNVMKNVTIQKLVTLCIITLSCLPILSSCGGGEQKNGKDVINDHNSGIKVLDIEKGVAQRDFVNLSKYATEINYIPLETRGDCMMGLDQHTYILKSGDRFYFSSWLSNVPLLAFDEKGKFIGTIGVEGRAANEYMRSIESFAANDQNGELVICDGYAKLLFYDRDGNFKTSKKIENEKRVFDYKLFSSGNGEYIFLKEEDYIKEVPPKLGFQRFKKESIITVNSQGDIINEQYVGDIYGYIYKTEHESISYSFTDALLYQFDNKFGLLINDSLYHYNPANGNTECRYVANFGKYDLGKESTSKVKIKSFNNLFFETDKFLLFSVIFPKSAFTEMPPCYIISVFAYDKESGDINALKNDPIYGTAREAFGGGGFVGFTNDLDGGAPFLPRHIKDGKMYELMDAVSFIEQAQKSKSAKMKKIAATLTEESNPILIEVTLK